MKSRNERVVIRSLVQLRKRSRRRRNKALWVLLDDMCADLSVMHPAIADLFRDDHIASHLVTTTTLWVRL